MGASPKLRGMQEQMIPDFEEGTRVLTQKPKRTIKIYCIKEKQRMQVSLHKNLEVSNHWNISRTANIPHFFIPSDENRSIFEQSVQV